MSDFVSNNYPEFLFTLFLVIAFLVSLSLPSAIFTYAMAVVMGMMAGRLVFFRQHKTMLPFVIVIIGFFIGFISGARFGSWKILSVLFILSAYGGWYLHEKEIIKKPY